MAICGRRPEPLEETRELETAGRDVRDAVRRARARAGGSFLDAVDERFGAVDVLVNNAGGQFVAPLEQIGLKCARCIASTSTRRGT